MPILDDMGLESSVEPEIFDVQAHRPSGPAPDIARAARSHRNTGRVFLRASARALRTCQQQSASSGSSVHFSRRPRLHSGRGVRHIRRFRRCFVAACAVAVLDAGTAPGKNGQGVMCVLNAELTAKSEITGSTSTARATHRSKSATRHDRIQDPDLEPGPRDIRGRPYPPGTRRCRRRNRGALVRIAHPVDERSPQ